MSQSQLIYLIPLSNTVQYEKIESILWNGFTSVGFVRERFFYILFFFLSDTAEINP